MSELILDSVSWSFSIGFNFNFSAYWKILFFRYADYVSVGDEVLAIQKHDELIPAKVINVSSFNMQGTFYPYMSFLVFIMQ